MKYDVLKAITVITIFKYNIKFNNQIIKIKMLIKKFESYRQRINKKHQGWLSNRKEENKEKASPGWDQVEHGLELKPGG
ncbi:MAG: hypothetical protein LBP92_12565 [Deltaproteobacteria bacterium]|jgi:t-SNARE complex subunit (syntaxin)|nr:hypothetical protein [Deltaproteobacteria bacterium]